MKKPSQTSFNGELLPVSAIRVETVLSRYPVHRLARKGLVKIDVNVDRENGETPLKWKVSHNSEFGQPGPLAYKLDTLVVNRRIEETARPISRLLKLGSLGDICRELGLTACGKNKNDIKNSLFQNAFSGITAKISYRQHDGSDRTLEAAFTRYSVILTGQKLPDGRKAEAVYIVLNDVFMQILNGATTRPLDYDYLKSLTPGAQRFYELLSYKIYYCLKHRRAVAKLKYSDFCKYSPQIRYLEWERVRKQMAKIHAAHINSGYIIDVDFQDGSDSDGNQDWVIHYQPGPKARAEYRAFNKRGGPLVLEVEPFPPVSEPRPLVALPKPPSPLVAELIIRGITDAVACQLVSEHGEGRIRIQLDILEWQEAKQPGKICDPAAWLVTAIKKNHAAPKGFLSRSERERREGEKRRDEQKSEEERRCKRQAVEAENEAIAKVEAYLAKLKPEDLKAIDKASWAQANSEELALEKGPFATAVRNNRHRAYVRQLLQERGELPSSRV